ncbi:hypothetical protein J3A83DRAFT_3812087 [Scleroderma citrinum]
MCIYYDQYQLTNFDTDTCLYWCDMIIVRSIQPAWSASRFPLSAVPTQLPPATSGVRCKFSIRRYCIRKLAAYVFRCAQYTWNNKAPFLYNGLRVKTRTCTFVQVTCMPGLAIDRHLVDSALENLELSDSILCTIQRSATLFSLWVRPHGLVLHSTLAISVYSKIEQDNYHFCPFVSATEHNNHSDRQHESIALDLNINGPSNLEIMYTENFQGHRGFDPRCCDVHVQLEWV